MGRMPRVRFCAYVKASRQASPSSSVPYPVTTCSRSCMACSLPRYRSLAWSSRVRVNSAARGRVDQHLHRDPFALDEGEIGTSQASLRQLAERHSIGEYLGQREGARQQGATRRGGTEAPKALLGGRSIECPHHAEHLRDVVRVSHELRQCAQRSAGSQSCFQGAIVRGQLVHEWPLLGITVCLLVSAARAAAGSRTPEPQVFNRSSSRHSVPGCCSAPEVACCPDVPGCSTG